MVRPQRIARGLANTNIGYSHIKERRMCHPVTVAVGGALGNYVPFNFCPRSPGWKVLATRSSTGRRSRLENYLPTGQTTCVLFNTKRKWQK